MAVVHGGKSTANGTGFDMLSTQIDDVARSPASRHPENCSFNPLEPHTDAYDAKKSRWLFRMAAVC